MSRRLFTVASALSLLLGLAVAVTWVRSYWRVDAIGRSTLDAESLRYTRPMIVIRSGRIVVDNTTWNLDRESFALWAADLHDAPTSIKAGLWHQSGRSGPYGFTTLWERFRVVVTRSHTVNQPYMGFVWFWYRGELRGRPQYAGRYSESVLRIDFPCGYLAAVCLIAGIPAIKSVCRVIRERGRDPALRCHCGYDLRASKERCPECGTLISSSKDLHRSPIQETQIFSTCPPTCCAPVGRYNPSPAWKCR